MLGGVRAPSAPSGGRGVGVGTRGLWGRGRRAASRLRARGRGGGSGAPGLPAPGALAARPGVSRPSRLGPPEGHWRVRGARCGSAWRVLGA